ncbi:MAG: hypothetical protein V3U57_06165 [Robiginitomaculum sp.]
MCTKTKKNVGSEVVQCQIPPDAARSYITDILGELCQVAEVTGQKDLLSFLIVARHAAQFSKNEMSSIR